MSKHFNKAALAVALALATAAGSAEAAFNSAAAKADDDLILIATDGTTTFVEDLATNASTFAAGTSQTFGSAASSALFTATFGSDLNKVEFSVYGGSQAPDVNGNYNVTGIYSAAVSKFTPDSSTPTNNDAFYQGGLPGVLTDKLVTLSSDGLSATELNSTQGPSTFESFYEDAIGFSTEGSVLGAGGSLPTKLNTFSIVDATDNVTLNETDTATKLAGTWSLSSTGSLQYTVATVPEPTTWALLFASMFAVVGFARRRNAI